MAGSSALFELAAFACLATIAISAHCVNCRLLDAGDIPTSEDDVSSLIQISKAVVKKSRNLIVSVDSITASGSPLGATPPDLSPKEYNLSKPAKAFGLNEGNAFLDGGDEEWKLYPDADGKLPFEDGGVGEEVMQVNDPGNRCSPGDVTGFSLMNVTAPSLVPFLVAKNAPGRKSAAVIVAPGGGYRFLSWNKEGTRIAKWLNSLGVSAFVLKYRVPCNTKETMMKCIADGQAAVTLVRSHTAEQNFKKVGFMGFSAGGFLTAAVGSIPWNLHGSGSAIEKIQGAQYTEADFKPDFSMILYAAGGGGGGSPEMPETAPPTFLAIAGNDPCVNVTDAQNYYTRLTAGGDKGHELHVFAGGKHGWGDCSMYVTGNSWQPVCAWTIAAQLFIEKQLGAQHDLGAMKYDDGFDKVKM